MLRRLLTALLLVAAFPAQAQDREVPYWASMRVDKVNMRVGPSENYPIDWVYRRAMLPVKVVRLYQGWRRVRDQDGAEGWIVARLLSPERTAARAARSEWAALRGRPSASVQLRRFTVEWSFGSLTLVEVQTPSAEMVSA